jgi:hypothetical protein
MTKVSFSVSFELPDQVTVDRVRDYVEDAVANWARALRPPGGFGDEDPGDPLFRLDPNTVRVTRLR